MIAAGLEAAEVAAEPAEAAAEVTAAAVEVRLLTGEPEVDTTEEVALGEVSLPKPIVW